MIGWVRRATAGGLWRHADFMKLWIGQSISQFGTPVSQLALPWIAVKTLNASPFAVAALGTVEFAPFLFFTLPAGVWVDRLPRRMVLIVGDLGRCIILLSVPIVWAFGGLTLAQLFIVGFLTGVLTVFFDVAYQSYLPFLVDREALVEGNSKLEVTRSSAQIAGPALGGGLIQVLTAPYAVLADAISYVVSGGFLVAIRRTEHPVEQHADGRRTGMRQELADGLRYVLGHRLLRAQAASTATANFFWNLSFSILIVYAARNLDMSAGLVGIAFGLGSIGWLLGALAAPHMQKRFGVGKATIYASLISGPSALLVPLAPKSFPLPFLVLSGILGGFGAVVYNIEQVSLRQAITPERLQGRMNSVMRFLVWGAIPIGSLTGGALATWIGLRPTLFLGGFAMLAVLPLVFSPIRTLQEMPLPEEILPSVAAATGIAGPVTAGVDEAGALAGAGPAAVDDAT